MYLQQLEGQWQAVEEERKQKTKDDIQKQIK